MMMMRLLVLLLLLLLAGAAAATAAPAGATASAERAKTVHVVFATHLDVGFTGLDNETINAYLHQHIPRAIWLAEWLPPPRRFVWTTHPWLLSLFLDCSEATAQRLGFTCPSPGQQARVRAAITDGTLSWHAAPFNLQYELLPGPGALDAALGVGWRLDDAFGLPRKSVLSLRDVPGLTRGAIPLLAGRGVRLVTVGVNGGSAPPDVPLNTPFVWRDPVTGTSVVALWHAGGYGGSCSDPTAPPDAQDLPVACARDCVTAAGLDDVLCLSWRNDNMGPPADALEVSAVLDLVESQWALLGASAVVTSSLQGWADLLLAALDAGRLGPLPEVTAEIGDTWVYGAASDPLKAASLRALARARAACVAAGDPACAGAVAAPSLAGFDRLLAKLPEHTAGLDVKATLQHYNATGSYANSRLAGCMAGIGPLQHARGQHQQQQPERSSSVDAPGCEGTRRLVASWQRQAAYADWALAELPRSHPIVAHAAADLRRRLQLAAQALQPPPRLHLLSRLRAYTQQPLFFRSDTWIVGVTLGRAGGITTLCRVPPPGAAHAPTGHTPASWWRRWLLQPRRPDPCAGSHNWLSAGRGVPALLAPRYQALRSADWQVVWDTYSYESPPNPWFTFDLGKPGLNTTWDRHLDVQAELVSVHDASSEERGLALHLHYRLPRDAVRSVGAPPALVLLVSCAPGSSVLEASLVWRGKPATRIPEALWLQGGRLAGRGTVDAASWRLHKLGSERGVAPGEVLRNGSLSMHAVDDTTGVSMSAPPPRLLRAAAAAAAPVLARQLLLTPLDAPLVSPGEPQVLPNVAGGPPDVTRHGVSFLLYNNVWGTNYPQWLPYQATPAAEARPPGWAAAAPSAGDQASGGGATADASTVEPSLLADFADQRVAVFRFHIREVQAVEEHAAVE